MANNCLAHQTLTVNIQGTSLTSKEDAVNTAFRGLQQEVAGKVDGIIIGIKPESVEITEMKTEEYTERFLFLFWPRKKEKAVIKMAVTVNVDLLEI